jgi:uncharacterized protein YkwD
MLSFWWWDYTQIVTNILQSIETTNANKSDLEKKQTFETYIPKIQSLSSIDQRVRDALVIYLKAKIEQIQKTSQTTIYTSNITNIDKQQIDQTRLGRHNAERNSLWLTNYTINADLSNTAQNRANYLAKINTATHKRTSTDWYYSYESIKSRFSNQGITFPREKNGIANFTENLAYQYVSCNKSDCTNETIAAMKKWFTFFMNEKYKSYKPHYNAIVSKSFTQLGYWIAKVGTKIFIVTHYSVDF